MNNEKPTFTKTTANEIASSNGFKVGVFGKDLIKYTCGDRELVFPFDMRKIEGKWHIKYSLPQELMLWQVPFHNEPITDKWIAKIKSDLTQLAEFENQIIYFD